MTSVNQLGKRPMGLTVQTKENRRSWGSGSGLAGRSPSFAGSINTQGSIQDPKAHLEETFNLAIAARERSQRLLGEDANPNSPVTEELFMQDQDFKVDPSFLKNKMSLLETFNIFRGATVKIKSEISPEDYAKEKNDKNSSIRKFLSSANRLERLYSYNHDAQTLVIPSGLEDHPQNEEVYDLSQSVENVENWKPTVVGESSEVRLDRIHRVLSGFDEATSLNAATSSKPTDNQRLTHQRSVSFNNEIDIRSDSGKNSEEHESFKYHPSVKGNSETANSDSTTLSQIAGKAEDAVKTTAESFATMKEETEVMDELSQLSRR